MTKTATTTSTTSLQQVVNAQLDSLDDTDPYATAWTAALRSAAVNTNLDKKKNISWGGRGQGGRGRARRTFQPVDVVVDNISLVYPGGADNNNKHQRTLLDDASLKLLAGGHVYALVGANGCGKSSLLRRIHSGSIPGFPPHISTLYLAQEVVITMDVDTAADDTAKQNGAAAAAAPFSVLDELLARHRDFYAHSTKAAQCAVLDLERQMEEDLDLTNPDDQERMQEIMEQISALEQDVLEEDNDNSRDQLRRRAQGAISFMMANVGNTDKNAQDEEAAADIDWSAVPISSLSMGLRKKAILATALLCPCDLLLLDEPAKFLDVSGLLQLRRLLTLQGKRSSTAVAAVAVGGEQQQPTAATTILLVSHDIDLINEVATDVIEMRNHKLYEYAGCNFDAYQRCKSQENRHLLSKAIVLDKKQAALQQTLQHLKAQPVSKRGTVSKKKGRRIGAHHTKMERVEREQQSLVDELQAANLLHPSCSSVGNSGSSSGVGNGKATTTIAAVNKSASGGFGSVSSSSSSLPPTEKAIQFVLRDPSSQWGEPLIIAFDVGHGYNLPPRSEQELEHHHSPVNDAGVIVKKKGYLFDFVDLCIEEGETYCILGSNASGKSTLLQILGKLMDPVEGRVKHALNIKVGYLDQELVDNMIQAGLDDGAQNAIIFLLQRFPKKTEQDIRSELINFGISPLQATTDLCFLSGGERSRVCLAAVMLQDPHVLLLDNPTSNLDPESVQALIHGLKQWKGTLVLVSHDAHLVRSLDAQCHVLMSSEGKLRRVQGGVDDYLRSFAMSNRTSSR